MWWHHGYAYVCIYIWNLLSFYITFLKYPKWKEKYELLDMSQAILKHDYHGENTLEGVSKSKIWKIKIKIVLIKENLSTLVNHAHNKN